MTELRELGRRLVDDAPVRPTARAELERRWRRRRSRRATMGALGAVVVGAWVAVGLVVSGGGGPVRARAGSPPAFPAPGGSSPARVGGLPGPAGSETTPAGEPVIPLRPMALAVGPNGNLYVADPARHQVLERLRSGRFVVVAGTGAKGSSGDGGPATQAELDDPAGMAFGPHGTLYVADQGSKQVRAVSASGIITTVAGGGTHEASPGFVAAGTPARQASLLNALDVAVGPQGRLYIATGTQVLRLEAGGTLTPVLGAPGPHQGLSGLGGPATAGSADGADGIAFDAAGDLYVAGSTTKSLLVVTPAGLLSTLPGGVQIYPRGDGGLAETPQGTVVAMDELSVEAVSLHGARTIASFQGQGVGGVAPFSPNGIAVGPTGTIYLDTFAGNGYANRSALVALSPNGATSRLLWESTPSGTGRGTVPTTTTTLPPGLSIPPAVASLPAAPSATIVLRGSGVGAVAFGTAESTAISQLEGVLGPPSTTALGTQRGLCTVDAWIGWPSLRAYFDEGSFVGYSTIGATAQGPSGAPEETAKGLWVGARLSLAESLYGPSLSTSFAQGGSWFATTPTGRLDGFLNAEPNQGASSPQITSIEAGAVGCPAVSP